MNYDEVIKTLRAGEAEVSSELSDLEEKIAEARELMKRRNVLEEKKFAIQHAINHIENVQGLERPPAPAPSAWGELEAVK